MRAQHNLHSRGESSLSAGPGLEARQLAAQFEKPAAVPVRVPLPVQGISFAVTRQAVQGPPMNRNAPCICSMTGTTCLLHTM